MLHLLNDHAHLTADISALELLIHSRVNVLKVRAKQLTRLPCLVVYAKFQFVYTTKSKMGSQLLLASTSCHVQL